MKPIRRDYSGVTVEIVCGTALGVLRGCLLRWDSSVYIRVLKAFTCATEGAETFSSIQFDLYSMNSQQQSLKELNIFT